MTAVSAPGPFNPSPALLRQAVTSANEAHYWAVAQAEGRVVPGVPNLGQRELDACVITVLLSHAALESEWHWQHVITETPRRAKWPRQFDRGLKHIAESRNRADPGPTSEALTAQLWRLGTWRNFFQHGDAAARARLAQDGLTVEDLGADYATAVIAQADALFARIAAATGGQPVGPSSVLWTGFPPTDN
jgi:hypothetical protein